MSLQFTDTVMSSFAPNKQLTSNSAQITSLDFDDSGQWCVSANSGETLDLWDLRSGKHDRSIPSKKYGCALARFTHNSTSCLYASTKEDDTLRYLDLHTNQYIRYFRGHKAKVHSLELSSVDDTLLSSGNDGTVRIWDLKSPNCQGLLNLDHQTPLLTTIDATGLVFAVLCREKNTVSVYDLRNFDKDPFLTFRCDAPGAWTKIEFSNDGKHILVATDSNAHAVFDSYTGELVTVLKGFTPVGCRSSSSAAFSIDGQYVFGACNDAKIAIWNLKDESKRELNPFATVQSRQAPSVLAFSPKTMLLASADNALTLWLPTRSA